MVFRLGGVGVAISRPPAVGIGEVVGAAVGEIVAAVVGAVVSVTNSQLLTINPLSMSAIPRTGNLSFISCLLGFAYSWKSVSTSLTHFICSQLLAPRANIGVEKLWLAFYDQHHTVLPDVS